MFAEGYTGYLESACRLCLDPVVVGIVDKERDKGAGYKRIWRTLKLRGHNFARSEVQVHCAHLLRTELNSIGEAEDQGVEVPDEFFTRQGIELPPEGVKWTAATVEQQGPNGEKHWLRVRPEEAEADRVEIRQAEPVVVQGPRPSPTILVPGNWQTWVANPDCQIGYWKDSEGVWHTIHDESAFSLGHQIAQAVAGVEGLHGWLDVGDFLDLAAPSRHHPTTIDLHVEGLNKTTARGAEELARRRWLVGEEGELVVMGGNHDCLSSDTQILTKRGFLSLHDLEADEEVLTVDDDGQSLWVVPIARVKYQYTGDMVHVYSRHMDALMTPNHRVVGRSVNTGKWEERLARTCGAPFLAVTAGSGTHKQSIYSAWDIRMAAWCYTDSYYDRNKWIFYQRDSKRQRIVDLLNEGGADFESKCRDRNIKEICGKTLKVRPEPGWEFKVVDPLINKELRSLVPDKEKLAPWVWDLSEDEVDLFIREWQYTDGSKKANANKGVMLYCSRDNLRRQLMALMVNNGYRVTESEYRPGHWRLNATKTTTAKVTPRERRIKGTGVEVVDYTGDVWCLSVPYERFFVCRNGKVFLTGNCRLPKKTAEDMPYLVGLKRPGDPEDEFPMLSVPYLIRARDAGVDWVSGYPSVYRVINSNLVAFHAPAYGSKALDTARKIAARVHASVVHGHTHRREALAENIETV